MNRRYLLVNAIGASLFVLTLACADAGDELSSGSSAAALTAGERAEHWRLIITRADGTVQTVLSADQPIICGSHEEPQVLLFCGRGIGTPGGIPAPAWDFLPVNVGAGDSYVVEPPADVTPLPTPRTPTRTPRRP